ncbi:conserved hypothetical protein [Candidatus Protochlamydia naegleriophila]|uniref:Zinc-ribbon domain-containing protein n=2 Tax=Candidatus Protochlamydia naegleriophila TaxID=389348 RepID=A0A0U5JJ56_9BACT|nr:conserved hypothetical protein [Candidatus Protochlamydia naegleriophila]
MFCPQCGAKADDQHKYCPSCGKVMNPNSLDTAPTEPTPQIRKKPMPLWFKILVAIAVTLLIGVTAGILFTERLVDVIDNQLEALRQNDVTKAYYGYTSKDFQAATSQEQFREFIETYPVFLNNQSAHFTQRSIDNNISTLKGNLTSQDHINTPIEYKLIKEDDKWKILSIRLIKPDRIPGTKPSGNIQDLIGVVQSQLQAIQDEKLGDAYQNYTSKEFREATSEAAFEEFIKRYPIFSDYQTASFHKRRISDGVGTLSVILQTDHLAAYVKYYLIYEDHAWKIWSLRILSPSEEGDQEQGKNQPTVKKAAQKDETVAPMSFGSIQLGSSANEEGIIQNPQTIFPSDLRDLYVDLEIKNGSKGSIIYLSLQHIESGSSIPAKATIEDEGDTMLMSVFSPPKSGWPKGHYKLVVTTSSGLNKIVDFDID